jgi:hypothetical protein
MTRSEILALIQQAAAALTTEPQTPATYTEEDRAMIREIHAKTVQPKRTVAESVREIPMFTSIPQSPDPPLDGEPKKKGFWRRLGGGVKTTLVAIGAGGGGAALSAAVDTVKDGNISPTGIGAAAISAAVAGAIGYRSKPPAKEE